MYLLWWYSEKSPVAELVFDMATEYIKQKLYSSCFKISSSAPRYNIIIHLRYASNISTPSFDAFSFFNYISDLCTIEDW